MDIFLSLPLEKPKIHSMKNFYQDGPKLTNTYRSDETLQKIMRVLLSHDAQKVALAHLDHLGNRAATDMLALAQDAEDHPPIHVPFDPWGRRIDDIQTSLGWRTLEKIAAEEGIVATAYDRTYGPSSRVYQMALLYLYSPSSAIFSCPLAMTDGAARALELFGDPDLQARALPRLLSRDPLNFWTAGQWMTERAGGSDVSGTSTDALPFQGANEFGATHALHGTKWFTSATTSQMALTLARPEGAPAGSKGLGLFFLELRNQQGQLNKIQIHRLKDKLGTKALPTAELSLLGTPARLIGQIGEGVKRIANVLNITRIYNSICAVGHMRRALDLAQDYSGKRRAFGKLLKDHPLHKMTLDSLETDFRRCLALSFFVVDLLGKEEVGEASASEKILLRTLTPILKLYTAKKALQISSEVVEIFGGAGYVEDTGIPRLLRDGQVFSIWEGTTNVLSLDMLRAFEKDQAWQVLMELLQKHRQMTALEELKKVIHLEPEAQEIQARNIAFLIADSVSGIALQSFKI